MATAKTKKSSSKALRIKVTQVGSVIGRNKKQEKHLIGLGLNKLGRVSVLEDTPSVMGMIAKVKHLVIFEKDAQD